MAERNIIFQRTEIPEEEDDYGYMIPLPALCLEGVPTKVNKAFPTCPTNGFEYLRMVQLQREKLVDGISGIHISSPPEAGCVTSNVAPVSSKKKKHAVPESEYHKSAFLSDLRVNYILVKNKLKDELCTKGDIVFPSISDERAWCAFFLGTEAYLKLQDLIPQEKNTALTQYNFNPEGYQALMSYVLKISEDDVPTLLKYHASWMKQLGFSHRQGEWVFALLVLVKRPLTEVAFDALKDMSKICSQLLRSEKEDDIIESLNFFVNQINRYFEVKIGSQFKRQQFFVPYTSNFKTVLNEDSSSDDDDDDDD